MYKSVVKLGILKSPAEVVRNIKIVVVNSRFYKELWEIQNKKMVKVS